MNKTIEERLEREYDSSKKRLEEIEREFLGMNKQLDEQYIDPLNRLCKTYQERNVSYNPAEVVLKMHGQELADYREILLVPEFKTLQGLVQLALDRGCNFVSCLDRQGFCGMGLLPKQNKNLLGVVRDYQKLEEWQREWTERHKVKEKEKTNVLSAYTKANDERYSFLIEKEKKKIEERRKVKNKHPKKSQRKEGGRTFGIRGFSCGIADGANTRP